MIRTVKMIEIFLVVLNSQIFILDIKNIPQPSISFIPAFIQSFLVNNLSIL